MSTDTIIRSITLIAEALPYKNALFMALFIDIMGVSALFCGQPVGNSIITVS